MDRGDQIIAIRTGEPVRETTDSLSVLIDVVGDGSEFGGRRFDGRGHDGTVPLGARNTSGAGKDSSVGFAA